MVEPKRTDSQDRRLPAAAIRWRQMLVPVRGGPDAAARVQLALSLASGIGASVTALYVIDERLLADADAALMDAHLVAQLEEEGESVLDAARLQSSQFDVPFATRLARGRVVEVIVQVAQEIQADVVVIGAHRQTWLGKLLGGSVAEAVLSAASCAGGAGPPGAPSASDRPAAGQAGRRSRA